MEFTYEGLDQQGKPQGGIVNAASQDAAIQGLQRNGLTITAIKVSGQGGGLINSLQHVTFFGGVKNRDLVMLSRQIATLFEAQVSALRVFRLLAEQAEKPVLRQILTEVSDDLQAGNSISKALDKHPEAFSDFYVNMVRAGEESGKLDQTFLFLADYIDRNYALSSKVRNALIYPGFIFVTFIGVMILMLTVIIPKIGSILTDSGGTLPVETQIVLGLSAFLVDYGIFILIAIIIGGYFVSRYFKTPKGALALGQLKLSMPYIGDLYKKLYLTRITDNMHIMLSSGISAVRSLEITAAVVDNDIYQRILTEALEGVKAGSSMSQVFAKYPKEIPAILVQMLQIGEETGEMGSILERLSKFYEREVNASVDTIVALIEPALIIALGLGVGFLLASVLLPIYNTTSNM
jgi:type IV pilus assembly protein PilC